MGGTLGLHEPFAHRHYGQLLGANINRQYRICFRWEDGHAYEVQIIDYH